MNEEMDFFEEDSGYEYVSEQDIAEENGCFIDDDGNWIPMDDDMEEALYEAREHYAWINKLKKKYAKGKPTPAPESEWPRMIADWKMTEEAKTPWFHICYWTGLGNHKYTQQIRDSLSRHGFVFDEEEADWGEFEIGVESVFGTLLDDSTEGQEDAILDSITIVDDVPYRDGLPAPVYMRYMNELEEYSWLPKSNISEYSVYINSIGELEVSGKWDPSTSTSYQDDDDEEDEPPATNSDATFKPVDTDELPF